MSNNNSSDPEPGKSGVQSPESAAAGVDSEFVGNLEQDESDPNSLIWKRKCNRERMHQALRYYIYKELLPKHPVSECRRIAIPALRRGKPTGFSGNIELRCQEDVGAHSYHGRKKCRSLLVCPECAVEYGFFLREVVATAAKKLLQIGYCTFMMTFTARHDRSMSLVDIANRFQEARRWFYSHKTWKQIKKELGIIGYFTTLEVTDDAPWCPVKDQTGWHWHTHSQVFFRPDCATEDERKKGKVTISDFIDIDYIRNTLQPIISKLWKRALNNFGLDCSLEHGLDIVIPKWKTDQVKEGILEYMGLRLRHETYDALLNEALNSVNPDDWMRVVIYIVKHISHEHVGNAIGTKKGRKAWRINTWEMLRLIAEGNKSLIPRFAEYMNAVRGRAFMFWSPGLRKFCDLPWDNEDELLKDCPKQPGDIRDYVWTNREYNNVVKYSYANEIIKTANKIGKPTEVFDNVEEIMNCLKKGMSREGVKLTLGHVLQKDD